MTDLDDAFWDFRQARRREISSQGRFLAEVRKRLKEVWPSLKIKESRGVIYGFVITSVSPSLDIEYDGRSWILRNRLHKTISRNSLGALRAAARVQWGIELPPLGPVDG
jgi:hypothetical protein